ncbi:lipoprotein lipase-like [Atheta coriaria]|uniref:lipoprotein lipase-like n=1 Tax=Dalotia coriaria TaxID=877792 RepID=UPI0031F3FE60
MAQVFLQSMDCYVIRVDYSALAGQNYMASANSVRNVGNYVGDFLIKITKQFSIPMSSVHVIGHSLGGQVSGFVGKRVIEVTGEKVHRISALDPAAPLFENNPDSMRLSRKDAQIVDVIHTDGGVLGCELPLGHVDFYPNGGKRWQPGCYSTDSENPIERLQAYMNDFYCSHHKSYHYFTASIVNNYMATKCNSWVDYQNGLCDEHARILFGARMPENATGSYFLEMDIDDEYAQDVLLASHSTL